MNERFDVVVIGGGPAGSTLGTLVAQTGKRVCILEREKFPRFHVGESLLPYNAPLFERLGVLEEMEDRRVNIRKYGATFMNATGDERQTYDFEHTLKKQYPYAYQVERAPFDEMLLNRSREVGADVREEWKVTELIREGARVVGVRGVDATGETAEVFAGLVVDASGRDTFIANKEKLRRPHPELKKATVFAHFDGVEREQGDAAGNIRIVAFEDGWAWVIPFASGRTSVGMVLHGSRFKQRTGSIAQFWGEEMKRAPALAKIMENATPVGEFHTIGAVAYAAKQWSGKGWVMIGDSAIFLDPVFSTGVLLAMTSAALVAETIIDAPANWQPSSASFAAYEKTVQGCLGEVYPFIQGFYDPSFFDQFMRPKNFLRVREAITSLLAGDVIPKWSSRWRRKVFWMGVKQTRKARTKEELPVTSTLLD